MSTILIVVLVLLLVGAIPGLAAQSRLGLLPQRRTRPDSDRAAGIDADRTTLTHQGVGCATPGWPGGVQ